MTRTIAVAAALAMAAACAGGELNGPLPGPTPQQEPAAADAELIPAGHGTLRQDDFTVSFRSGSLLLKVTPLNESIVRLAAPDTYERLRALAGSRLPDATRASGLERPELMLVSVFSYESDASYEPSDLQIAQRGRLLRPAAILPVTPGWGGSRLQQQETQVAIYVFEPDIDFRQAFTVRYKMEQSDMWGRIVSRLEQERQRVLGRAGGG
jgi:hypothetical protein